LIVVTSLLDWGLRVRVVAKLQELLSILTTNHLISLSATKSQLDLLGVVVPPATAILNGLVWVINREEDALGAKVVSDVSEGLGAEVTTGGDPDVVVEVVVEGALADDIASLGGKWLLDILEPVVGAPEVEWNVLTKMTDNDLQLREAVEDTVGDDTEEVERYSIGEGEWWTNEVLALSVLLPVLCALWGGWVDVDGHIQLLDDLPEGIIVWLIIVEVSLPVRASVLHVIQERTMEAKLCDTAAELSTSLRRVVHGETGKGAEAVAVVLDLIGDVVVAEGCMLLSASWVGNALDTRDGKGDNSVTDTVGIGNIKSLGGDGLDLAHVSVKIFRRNVKSSLLVRLICQSRNLVGLLESDFSEHLEN